MNLPSSFRVSAIGMITNIVFSCVKIFIGISAKSQALVADGLHSLSDLGTDIAVLMGMRFWSAPPDRKHPYGHGRIETFTTVTIAFLLGFAAVGIFWNSIKTFQEKHESKPECIAFWVAIVSILAKESLFWLTLKVGKKEKSSAIIVNAWHHRSDAFSSIPVAVAILIATIKPQWAFVDNLAAIVVSVIILVCVWGILKKAVEELTDKGIQDDIGGQIEQIALQTEGVKSVHAIRGRSLGKGICVDLHIRVDKNLTVEKGHAISMNVKKNLLNHGTDVLDVVVHLEPDNPLN